MAYMLGGDFGGSTLASTVSDSQKRYDPVYLEDVNAEFIWQLLPSAYRDLMDDRDVFTKSWEASIRVTSGLLLDTWQAAAAQSLRDIPIHQQRKWIRYDLIRTVNFSADPSLTVRGIADRLEWDASTSRLAGSWVNRHGHDKSTVALNGSTTDEGSLSWAITASFSAVEIYSGAQFGYFNSKNKTALADALVVGAIADGDGVLVPFAGHYSEIGVLTSSLSAYEISTDVEYRFAASYQAKDGILSLTLFELNATKLEGDSGATDTSSSEDIYTAGFSDDSKDFGTEGVEVGDKLVLDSDEYVIVEVSGSSLVVASVSLPAGVSSITYSISGPLQRASVSLDLPNRAGDPKFTVDEFGTAAIDLRSIFDGGSESIYGATFPTTSRRKRLTGHTDDWEYFDPTVSETLLSVPVLQDMVTTPSLYLYEGSDFEVVSSAFRFKEPPTSAMWAEYSTYDEGVLYDNFGAHVGLDQEESSSQYRSKVRGLFYAYYQGPTPNSIKTGVQILLGLPIAEESGTVESVNDAYSGDFGELTVDGTGYLYPLLVGTSLTVGDPVSRFDPLCDGVEIKDYLTHPEWFVTFPMHEVGKFHTFAVFLNIDAFAIDDLGQAASFVETIKPTWKKALFVVHKDVEDEVDLDDDVKFLLTLNLYDIPCDEPPLIAYDDAIYEGEEADWKYDQGVEEWDETSAAMRETGKDHTSELLQAIYSDSEIRPYLTGTATLTNGSTSGVGSGTSWLAEMGSATYLATALVLSGSDGVSVAGDQEFTDTVTGFTGVEAGDSMTIDGTDYEVQSVDSGTQVTLDSPLPTDSTGVSWSTIGQLKIWGEIGSVSGDTSFDFTSDFDGDDGVYKLTILDPDYKEALYDAFMEQCPEEEFTLVADISVGYEEAQLTGRVSFTESSVAVEGNSNVQFVIELGDQVESGSSGSTDSPGSGAITFSDIGVGKAFLTTIPNGGAGTAPTNHTYIKLVASGATGQVTKVVSDDTLELLFDEDLEGYGPGPYQIHDNTGITNKYIVARDGTWHEVTAIIDNDSIQVDPVATEDSTSVRSYIADQILSDTLTFDATAVVVSGSDLSVATGTGELEAGDWIQAVPGGEPVVEILSISGVNITLTGSYSGNPGTFTANKRGDSGVLPKAVTLPSGVQNFTDWYGTAGGTLSDTIPEPI